MTIINLVKAFGFAIFTTAIVIFISSVMTYIKAGLGFTVTTVLMFELGSMLLFFLREMED